MRSRPHALPSYVVGIDDAPFEPTERGDVPIIGAVFNGARLEGIVRGKVRRDGANATTNVAQMLERSRFGASLQAVLLQGVTLGGFNVLDLSALSERLALPVIAVCRRKPDLARIERALLSSVPGGRRKWRVIRALPPAHRHGAVYIQCTGIDTGAAGALVDRLASNSRLPEPLRTAHLIAAAFVGSTSRQRA